MPLPLVQSSLFVVRQFGTKLLRCGYVLCGSSIMRGYCAGLSCVSIIFQSILCLRVLCRTLCRVLCRVLAKESVEYHTYTSRAELRNVKYFTRSKSSEKNFTSRKVRKGLFTYYVSQIWTFLDPPSPPRQQSSSFA